MYGTQNRNILMVDQHVHTNDEDMYIIMNSTLKKNILRSFQEHIFCNLDGKSLDVILHKYNLLLQTHIPSSWHAKVINTIALFYIFKQEYIKPRNECLSLGYVTFVWQKNSSLS